MNEARPTSDIHHHIHAGHLADERVAQLRTSLEKSTGKSEESELENSTHLRSLGSVQIMTATSSRDAEIQTDTMVCWCFNI